MKKFFFHTIAAIFLINIFSGCSSSFLAVSGSSDLIGGIYRITDGTSQQVLTLPTLNCLLRSKDGKYLYGCVNNTRRKRSKFARGGIAVVEDLSGTMILRKLISADIKTPCHLTLSPDGKFLYSANYSSSSICEFKLANGIPEGSPRIILHSGHSVTRRQRSPHPHFVGFNPSGTQLFVCDLGTDEIYIYDYTSSGGIALPCREKLKLPPGSGPRHLAFSPCGKYIYVANELSSTVTSFRTVGNSREPVKTISTRPENSVGKNFPGAIKITSCGKLFFVTNRGDDTIAVFAATGNGDFKLLKNVPAHGKYPSDILLLDDEETLAVVNLKSCCAATFKLDKGNGELTLKTRGITLPRGIGLCE